MDVEELKVRDKLRRMGIKSRLKQWKGERTSIEKIIEQGLIERKIDYRPQWEIMGVTIADFYLPKIKTVIYCDGDYWHNLPDIKDRDRRQEEFLTKRGFKIIRFKEKDIKKYGAQLLDDVVKT